MLYSIVNEALGCRHPPPPLPPKKKQSQFDGGGSSEVSMRNLIHQKDETWSPRSPEVITWTKGTHPDDKIRFQQRWSDPAFLGGKSHFCRKAMWPFQSLRNWTRWATHVERFFIILLLRDILPKSGAVWARIVEHYAVLNLVSVRMFCYHMTSWNFANIRVSHNMTCSTFLRSDHVKPNDSLQWYGS